MAGRLTTHVLDLAHGRPARSMSLQLWRLGPQRSLLSEAITNQDGRTPQPLLADGELQPGPYELLFFVADYFRSQSISLPNPAFLDRVPIHFGVADPRAHYHVPLLVTPWAYQTYRGS